MSFEPCEFCGQPIMRYEVPFTERSETEQKVYHASCYAEKKIRDMQNERDDYYKGAFP